MSHEKQQQTKKITGLEKHKFLSAWGNLNS